MLANFGCRFACRQAEPRLALIELSWLWMLSQPGSLIELVGKTKHQPSLGRISHNEPVVNSPSSRCLSVEGIGGVSIKERSTCL
jgi:hypothetical protein